MSYNFDAHFGLFAKSLENLIAGYGSNVKNRNKIQKEQFERLIKLEKKFKNVLKKHRWGKTSVKAFIDNFNKVNVLTAQPYFRERKVVFGKKIIKTIKAKNINQLLKYNINMQFINFILKQHKWGKKSELVLIAKEITELRTQMITENLPLAISKARVFWTVTPHSHLSLMDCQQIAAEGLISAIDKFVLPFRPEFRSVILGMAGGNLIDSYSDTLLHIYPRDRNVLYRANKANRTNPDSIDFEKLTETINENVVIPNKLTTPGELMNLMAGASSVSLDSKMINADGEESTQQACFIDNSKRPDLLIEDNDAARALKNSYKKLSVWEQRILKLKGIEL